MQDITDGVDVRDVGLLVLLYGVDLAILLDFNSSLVKSKVLRQRVSPNGKENCVVLFLDLLCALFVSHSDLPFRVVPL